MRVVFRCDPSLTDLLPPPVPAKAALPDWLRAMAPRVPSDVHGRPVRTVKQCPPFVDAMAHGFMILLPCDVTITSPRRFEWHWPQPPLAIDGHPRAPLSFHVPEQVRDTPLARDGAAILKFNSFWTIELEPGWSLMAVHPINRDDLPFRLITGIVDADRFHDVGINFPAVWTDHGFSGVLPRGTPVAQCFAVPREKPELIVEAMSGARRERYVALADRILSGPGVYRKGFRSKRGT